MKKAFFLMTLLGVSALLVQISNSSQTDSNTIQIIIGDFYFKPKTIQLRAGQQVKIELINEGKLEHEFMAGRGLKTEEGKDETHKGMHEANEEKQETSKPLDIPLWACVSPWWSWSPFDVSCFSSLASCIPYMCFIFAFLCL